MAIGTNGGNFISGIKMVYKCITPDLNSLLKISDLFQVDIKELIVREYKQCLISQESK